VTWVDDLLGGYDGIEFDAPGSGKLRLTGDELRDPDLWYEAMLRQAPGSNPPHPTPDEFDEVLREFFALLASSTPESVLVAPLDVFTAVKEQGAKALLGDDDDALTPDGGDVMVYGNGGAGKTTLMVDLAFHLAAGDDWLGIPVRRRANVLLIENEGPRPMFRDKLRRKQQAWTGSPVGRLDIIERPWGEVTLATDAWRAELAAVVQEREIDVIVAGPLSRLGMDAPGTLQEVAAFMRLVDDVRRRCGRRLTDVLVHHENKGGSVSGAWEGSGDTLLHVAGRGNGFTDVHVQKARWATTWHDTTLQLEWTPGESYRLKDERDLLAEVQKWLADNEWRTSREIARPQVNGGIGASRDAVQALLIDRPDLFEQRTGEAAKEVGRHPNATVWRLAQPQKPDEPDEPDNGSRGGANGCGSVAPPLRGATRTSHTTPTSPDVGRHPEPDEPRVAIAVAETAPPRAAYRPRCSCADGGFEAPGDRYRCGRCWGRRSRIDWAGLRGEA
jgi:hypothetical protein